MSIFNTRDNSLVLIIDISPNSLNENLRDNYLINSAIAGILFKKISNP